MSVGPVEATALGNALAQGSRSGCSRTLDEARATLVAATPEEDRT